MKVFAGLSSIVVIVAAVYVGLFQMFIPGLTEVIHQFTVQPVDPELLTWGIVKVVFAWPVTLFIAWLGTVINATIFIGCSRD